jgi:ankyrin repeat protein
MSVFDRFGKRNAQVGATALIWAASGGHANCVRLLLDAGADTEAKNQARGRSLCLRCFDIQR